MTCSKAGNRIHDHHYHRDSLFPEDNISKASRQYGVPPHGGLEPCSANKSATRMTMTTREAARVSRGHHGSHSNTGTIPRLALAWLQSDNSIEQQVEAERTRSTWLYRLRCFRSRYHCYCHRCYCSHCDSSRGGPTGNVVDGRRVLKGCELASYESCQAPKANQACVEQEHARIPSRHSRPWSAGWHGPDLVKSASPWL